MDQGMRTEGVMTDLCPEDVPPFRDNEATGMTGTLTHRLRQCEGGLDTLIHYTEDAFLVIGSALRDFYDRARKISEMSSAVAARMTGAEIVGSIDDLNGLLERMEAYLRRSEAETESRTATLREILALMEGIYGPLEDLQRITKALKSLHIAARIQFSPLMARNTELRFLLDDVKKLSEVMTRKSRRIREDLRSLERSVGEALSRFLVFKGEEEGRAKGVLDHTMSVLCSITGQYGLSTKAAQDISERSAAISRSVGEIVTSVQFHDIVRQQCERIRKALQHAAGRRPLMANGQVFGARDHRGADTSAWVTDLCMRAVSEVSTTGHALVTAAGRIVENLGNIAVNVRTISADAQKTGGLGGADKKTLLTEAECLLSSVTASFAAVSENADVRRELSRTLRSLVGATAEMAGFTGEIEEIAEDVELIAFNTEIKSSQIGTEGAAFEIVAESIRRLSAETYTRAQTVSELLKAITSAANALSASSGGDSGDPPHEQEDISADFERLISTFSRVNKSIVSLFAEIEKAGEILSRDIERMAGDINVHAAVDRIVAKVVSSLNDAAARADIMLPAGRVSASGRLHWTPCLVGDGMGEGNNGTYDGVDFFDEGRMARGPEKHAGF